MVTGGVLKDALISGANNIKKYCQLINELNVFPVPDGDTGTNMYMTVNLAAKEIAVVDDDLSIGEISKIFADALLRNARGNSGVILSLIFRGFSKHMIGKEIASVQDFSLALDLGVKTVYDVVMKPTEGTILTVARRAAEESVNFLDINDIGEFWSKICVIASETLDLTPTMLPVLKQAGVVDAGGKGLLVIFQGMLSVFKDNIIIDREENEECSLSEAGTFAYHTSEDIKFRYCTEFLIMKENLLNEVIKLRAYLESIGDSVVVVDAEEIIKVHAHTNDPGKAITMSLQYGSLTNIKIDNMKEQYNNKPKSISKFLDNNNSVFQYVPIDNNREFGFVAISAGEGIYKLFKDLGVDNIVNGGQTMNPSTDDILSAIHATPAKTVFVLPNNKNIIMAAEQAIHMADRNVCVLQSRTIPQGLSAMLVFDPKSSFEDNRMEMTKGIDKVSTGHITFAARDSDFDGYKIKSNDILAFSNGKLVFVGKTPNKACIRLIKNMLTKDSSFITILYGADIREDQAEELKNLVKSKYGDNLEINIIYGGQPVYYYIISVE